MFKVYNVFLVTLCELYFEQLNICWIGGGRDSEWQGLSKVTKTSLEHIFGRVYF